MLFVCACAHVLCSAAVKYLASLAAPNTELHSQSGIRPTHFNSDVPWCSSSNGWGWCSSSSDGRWCSSPNDSRWCSSVGRWCSSHNDSRWCSSPSDVRWYSSRTADTRRLHSINPDIPVLSSGLAHLGPRAYIQCNMVGTPAVGADDAQHLS